LRQLAPGDVNHAFFGNSGSEATESALKIALAYHSSRGDHKRMRFVGRERAYHGVNFGAMSVGGIPANRSQFGHGLPGVLHLPHIWPEKNQFRKGQPSAGVELAESLQHFCDFYGAETIAACIVELVAGSAGIFVPPKGYLDRLREICNSNGILLIFDEVITAFGRLGEMFGSHRFGVTPDMICIAKGLTNGSVPMSALLVNDDIYDTVVKKQSSPGIELYHGYTYSAHPVACAAALATLDIFEKEDLVGQAKRIEQYFLDAVFSLQGLRLVTDIRGIGLMAAVDLAPRDKPGSRGLEIGQKLFEAGVAVKFTGDTFIIGPALTITSEEIDRIVDVCREVLETCD
jgi:beta-alanine--pyruvate transaminase